MINPKTKKYNFKNITGFAVGIVSFDTGELLPDVISEMREYVDYIAVALQKISYHGEPISASQYNGVYSLKDDYPGQFIDEIIEVDLDRSKEPRLQETDKRNMLAEHFEKLGYSHCLIIDEDELWKGEFLLHMLKEIDKNGYEITYARYMNFYHSPMTYLKYPFNEMYVNCISRTNKRFMFECLDFAKPSDPTRRYVRKGKPLYTQSVNGQMIPIKERKDKNGNIIESTFEEDYHIFPWEEARMYHLSVLRKNVRAKFSNWSSRGCFADPDSLTDVAVYDYESFDPNNPKPIHLLFNTPNNQVDVVKLDKPYFTLKYDYKNCLPTIYDQKNILILVCSTNKEFFNKEVEVIKRTWASESFLKNYPNVNVIYVVENPELPDASPATLDWSTHTLYVKNDGRITNTATKLYLAYSYIINKTDIKFDYVVKTNTSTYINIPLLDEFVGYLDYDVCNYTGEAFAAHWSGGEYHCAGNLTIVPKRNFDITFKNATYELIKKHEDVGILDDVLFSNLYNERLLKLNIPTIHHLHTVGILHNFGKPYIDDNVKNYIGIQVKNYINAENSLDDREKEIDDLYKIHNIINNKEYINDCSDYYDALMDNLDKDYYILKYNYKDWANPKIKKPTTKFDLYTRYSDRESAIKNMELFKADFMRFKSTGM